LTQRVKEENEVHLKDVERRLIAELMLNSRRSDRDLSRAVGVSQPTVSRLIKKLENQGVIKEYTMIPDFQKLGFELLVMTFIKLKRSLTAEEADRAREITKQRIRDSQFAIIATERGMGLGYDGVVVSLYEDFASYIEHKNQIQSFAFLELSETESFIISLNDKVRYRQLTLSALAKHLLIQRKT